MPELEPWVKEARIRAALVAAAVEHGAIVPATIAELYAEQVQVTEEGEVVGVDEVIQRARRERGSLWRPQKRQSPGQTGGAPFRS